MVLLEDSLDAEWRSSNAPLETDIRGLLTLLTGTTTLSVC